MKLRFITLSFGVLLLSNRSFAQNYLKQDSLVAAWMQSLEKHAKTAYDTVRVENEIQDSVINIIISRKSNCWATPDSMTIFFIDDTDCLRAAAFEERHKKKEEK